ncbi:hypothetical protein SLEP1_g57201 [Rubroshorea leprosula]|uniref:Uncharacterized protein n=1 Tax=Rubroshorea leprosula TaxID=152421 RepID=A0AAV5MKI1_9ROSI|nr:hypothetical protein SLEP1_g57201 [Rubroshorea leprosula]
MKQLRYLNLSYAQFRGRILGELGNLTKLHVLDLSQNYYERLKVDDDIQWISCLSSLQRLDLSGVNLSHASSNLFQHFRVSALFSFLPTAEHHQPFPAPSSEKKIAAGSALLLPSLWPAVAGYKLRFFLCFPNLSNFPAGSSPQSVAPAC